MNAVALLKPGVTLEQFQSELSAIAKRLEEQYPVTNRGFGVQVVPIRRSYVDSGVDRMGVILMTAVGFVLLIMCANLANLMLVRGASRQRELAVRSAMGAGGARLVWVALTESVLLAVPGTIIGVIASQWAIDWMISSFPEELPYWFTFGVDWRVALFTIGVAVFTTLAVGLLPSLRAAKPDLVNDLKEAGRGLSLGRAGHRLQAALAISQVALCFGLLVGANLMVTQLHGDAARRSRLRSPADRVGARLSGRRCHSTTSRRAPRSMRTSSPRWRRCRAHAPRR